MKVPTRCLVGLETTWGWPIARQVTTRRQVFLLIAQFFRRGIQVGGEYEPIRIYRLIKPDGHLTRPGPARRPEKNLSAEPARPINSIIFKSVAASHSVPPSGQDKASDYADLTTFILPRPTGFTLLSSISSLLAVSFLSVRAAWARSSKSVHDCGHLFISR